MGFEAIIFDCDGTLVDSELLGKQVLVECAAELGLTFPLAEAVAQLTGARMTDCVAAIERRLGHAVPMDFVPEVRRRTAAAIQADLQPIPGVETVVRGLQVPYGVASSAPREKIELSLGVTGLLPYFHGRIYSGDEAGSWKPAPGLFLYAACALGVPPARCAVIEDSVPGVQAGKAAGMTVFGYAPSGNGTSLAAVGAHPFAHMSALLPLLS